MLAHHKDQAHYRNVALQCFIISKTFENFTSLAANNGKQMPGCSFIWRIMSNYSCFSSSYQNFIILAMLITLFQSVSRSKSMKRVSGYLCSMFAKLLIKIMYLSSSRCRKCTIMHAKERQI